MLYYQLKYFKNEMLNKFKKSGYEIISSKEYLDRVSYD